MTVMDRTTLHLADGRALDVRTAGPTDSDVLVFCHGTPQSAGLDRVTLQAALDRGLRVVAWSRPGYSTSSGQPGRTVASFADDAREVLDQLGISTCLVAGWSGGGPHALSLGAGLPDRVRAVAVLAGVAPYAESQGSLDFLAGMGEDNIAEFGAAIEGEQPLREFLAEVVPVMAEIQRDDVVEAMGTLLPDEDRAWIAGDFGIDLATGFREAVELGMEGWVDDDLAFVSPWGFELGLIDVPVAIWQGSEDLMVPAAHGPWLVEHVAGARPHLLEGEGHLSVVLGRVGEILDDLVALGRR
jgi:pimeloyl-ACP methyl ester carboxylesterase